ncbi:MAG: hypothetical protein O3B24_10410, partial [Verrucomicrobia bacterium]|nr:hypothetical protein [Verrucomicrobiota bacterium]
TTVSDPWHGMLFPIPAAFHFALLSVINCLRDFLLNHGRSRKNSGLQPLPIAGLRAVPDVGAADNPVTGGRDGELFR